MRAHRISHILFLLFWSIGALNSFDEEFMLGIFITGLMAGAQLYALLYEITDEYNNVPF